MAKIISKGFVINLINYDVFDQIITILDEKGDKYSLISFGSRKIESKNGRHLVVGNFNENEYFPSRTKNKIGRLKKTSTILPIPWKIHDYLSFHLINEYLNLITFRDKKVFLFYKNIINILKSFKYKDITIIIYILIYIINTNNLMISKTNCSLCYSKNVNFIQLKTYLWFCGNCIYTHQEKNIFKNNEILDLLFKLINKSEINTKITIEIAIDLIFFLQKIILDLLGISFKCLNKVK
ncbi:hypothetical protein [Mycoplasmoides alvi]|uniref:hypothetical protein n=1 Tax=Mycoplasmoides alvi TaxID=78580 RepID=UPI000698D83E|nr:hypothetical protein [Mycoplasmoides alvi]